jgi:hypothetical protein
MWPSDVVCFGMTGPDGRINLPSWADWSGISAKSPPRYAPLDMGATHALFDAFISYLRIGDVRLASGDRAGALMAYEESLANARKLAAANPGHAGPQRDVYASLEHDRCVAAGDQIVDSTFCPCIQLPKCYSDTVMATLTHLVSTLASITGLPRSKVFAYGRFAREAGHISQKTRGPGAAAMTVRDAANLLVAVCGTDVTRNAGHVIEALRPMKGAVWADEFMECALSWLAPLGIRETKDMVVLKSDFGAFLEFLIEAGASGQLHRLLSSIPFDAKKAPRFSRPPIYKFQRHFTPREAMAKLQIVFDQAVPIVEVNIGRWWRGSEELVISLTFVGQMKDSKGYRQGDFETTSQISAATLAAVGFTVMDKEIPTVPYPPLLADFFPGNALKVNDG